MKVQSRSYSNSFIFLLLYSSFRISPQLKARAQTIPPACCHLGALNGSCFWSENRMPGSEAFPLGCLTESWKCEGKNIYVFSKRVKKKKGVCFQSQYYVTLCARKHLQLIFHATVWGQSGWQKISSYHPCFSPKL